MKGKFVPIPSGDLVIFVGKDPEPYPVIGWLVAVETNMHFDTHEFSLHTLTPVYLYGDAGPTQTFSDNWTMVRRDELDRV